MVLTVPPWDSIYTQLQNKAESNMDGEGIEIREPHGASSVLALRWTKDQHMCGSATDDVVAHQCWIPVIVETESRIRSSFRILPFRLRS